MFLKGIYVLHHYRAEFQKNPLFKGLLINADISSNHREKLALQMSEIAVMAKKREIQALEEKFAAARGDVFERYNLKGEIDEAKRQLKQLERVDFLSSNLLQDGLNNNLNELRSKLDQEPDVSKRLHLEKRIEACNKALEVRKQPIKKPGDIDEVKDQVRKDDYFLKRLQTGTLDQKDVFELLSSDYLPFFDARFQEQLKKASEEMHRVELIDARRAQVMNKVIGVEKEWKEHVEDCKKSIADLETRERLIKGTLGASILDKKYKERLEIELQTIQSELPKIKLHIQNDHTEWTERRIREKEHEQRKKAIDVIDPEILTQLRQIITEAKDLRLGKVHEYLESEFKSVEKAFDHLKTNKAVSQKTVAGLADEITEAQLSLLDRTIEDPATLKKIAENIAHTKKEIVTFSYEMSTIEGMRPTIEKKSKSKFGRLKKAIQSIPKEDLEAAKGMLLKQAHANGKTPENSPILKKELEGLAFMSGKGGAIKLENGEFNLDQAIEALEKKLEAFHEMSNEEIKAFTHDLETYSRLITDRVDARKAHTIISNLEQTNDLKNIRFYLENQLGKEHLEIVKHQEFRDGYKEYTQKGYMVFYQKGDEWKIIIDEDAFKTSGDTPREMTKRVQELKAQVKHELFHLEFNKNPGLRGKVRYEMIEKDPEAWKEIKVVFLEMAKAYDKSAPTGGEWADEQILSELFAMQDELGNILSAEANPEWVKNNPTKAKLNDLLFQLRKGEIENEEIEKINKRYAADQVKIEGAESGVQLDDQHVGFASDKEFARTEAEIPSMNLARYASNQNDITQNILFLKELADSKYLKLMDEAPEAVSQMIAFNERTSQLNEQLKANPSNNALAKSISDRIRMIREDVTKFNDELRQVITNLPNRQMGPLRQLWNNTQFLSLADIVKMGSDVKEYMGRRFTRRNEDNAARLGMALFTGTNLGSEFRARQQKSEAGEVQEWQSRYPNLDAWQIIEELKSVSQSLSPNRDQLKAILRLLAQKGRLEWQNPDLWRVLNKLQSSTEFIEKDENLLRNPILLRSRMQLALGEIFDNDEFPSLERDNLSAYEGNKSKFTPSHDRMPTLLTKRLDELLDQHRKTQRADPQLYESILEDCATKGRSYGENVFFHIIAGMASGLLAPDRGLALSSKLTNGWPPIDWFGSISPPATQEDWEKLCNDNFKEAYEAGSIGGKSGAAFKNWFWTTVQMHKNVVQRAQKSVGERGWDHDWGRTIACLGDADTAQRFFSGRGGQKETKPTAVGNAVAGMLQMLEENALNRKNINRKEFARITGMIAMTEGILNGTAYGLNDTYTRETAEINNEPPRESSHGRHAGKSTLQHRRINASILRMLDPHLFGKLLTGDLSDRKRRTERGLETANYIASKYSSLAETMKEVSDIDGIYNRLGLITQHILDNMTDDQFESILDQIAAQARAAEQGKEVVPAVNDAYYGSSGLRMAA